ncbi:hypothetical protein BLS_008061 [Venturia inaequalis]|uniref:Fucose-specific lectin n=1 Tax=Venturia inaequalis TaxID=5025 RepID=A0A8H3YM62_VENIN|nr:hypothetical protein BLS_008061 [Venturia inaequalis]KAE9981175.1 hypothetical protein EG327_006339 [Venturia inaequalis]
MASPAPAYDFSPRSAFTEDWDRSLPTQEIQLSPKRKSDPSQHPDVLSPGKEVYETEGKEVVPQPEGFAHSKEHQYSEQDVKYPVHPEGHATERKKRTCGIGIPGLLVLFILIAVALGVGLGVGLSHTKKSRSSTPINHDINSAYMSKSGAFNGSGLALASYSFGTGGYGVINVFFQHWSGQLRKMQLMEDGSWTGGDFTSIVATDARNATPISAVAYAMDRKSTVHIFYIDIKNKIREKIYDNSTNNWRDGPIGALGLVAMNETNVGLQACWYGSFYGNANYTHSPIPGSGRNTTSQDQVIGMHLWYGVSPTLLEEVTWTYNTSQWYKQDYFTANGHAGIGCYSWGAGSISYVMLVNLDNAVQMAWKDLNSTVAKTGAHPVNTWVNTTFTIPDVDPNTSLGYTNYFYAQRPDGRISGWNVSWNAEKTKLTGDAFTIPKPALDGTRFSVTTLPNKSGGDSLLVFNQQNGTDITQNFRDFTNGQWSYSDLPVPKT